MDLATYPKAVADEHNKQLAGSRRVTLPELIEEMSRRGYSTKQIRDELKSKGLRVRFNHTGTEQPGSRAAKRRVKQMNSGQLPTICETPDCGRLIASRRRTPGASVTIRLCDNCLAMKWAVEATRHPFAAPY